MASIRAALSEDIEDIRRIELRAGQLFAEIGMQHIADHPLPSAEHLQGYIDGGRAWVAEVDGQPAGFALADIIDGHGHVEQVSVDPSYARRRIGRDLIEEVDRWAAAHGYAELTLTTFREVPWNGPYYARLGFETVEASDLTPGLVDLLAVEAEHGLDPAQRIVMRRRVPGSR